MTPGPGDCCQVSNPHAYGATPKKTTAGGGVGAAFPGVGAEGAGSRSPAAVRPSAGSGKPIGGSGKPIDGCGDAAGCASAVTDPNARMPATSASRGVRTSPSVRRGRSDGESVGSADVLELFGLAQSRVIAPDLLRPIAHQSFGLRERISVALVRARDEGISVRPVGDDPDVYRAHRRPIFPAADDQIAWQGFVKRSHADLVAMLPRALNGLVTGRAVACECSAPTRVRRAAATSRRWCARRRTPEPWSATRATP